MEYRQDQNTHPSANRPMSKGVENDPLSDIGPLKLPGLWDNFDLVDNKRYPSLWDVEENKNNGTSAVAGKLRYLSVSRPIGSVILTGKGMTMKEWNDVVRCRVKRFTDIRRATGLALAAVVVGTLESHFKDNVRQASMQSCWEAVDRGELVDPAAVDSTDYGGLPPGLIGSKYFLMRLMMNQCSVSSADAQGAPGNDADELEQEEQNVDDDEQASDDHEPMVEPGSMEGAEPLLVGEPVAAEQDGSQENRRATQKPGLVAQRNFHAEKSELFVKLDDWNMQRASRQGVRKALDYELTKMASASQKHLKSNSNLLDHEAIPLVRKHP